MTTRDESNPGREITHASTLADTLPALSAPWSVRRTRDIILQRRWTWRRSQLLVGEVPIAAEIARGWLPPGLSLADEPRATVFVAHYPDTAMGFEYREAAVLIHAKLRGRRVLHCAWMVVDDDTALILGRELLGFPKKLARIDFDFEAGTASVERRGVRVLAITSSAAGAGSNGPAFPGPIVNLRGIPGALPNVLVAMEPNERCHASDARELRVTTQPSVCDPLTDLGMDGAHLGRRMVVDLAHPEEEDSTRFPASPTALASPTWLWSAYPFRTW